MPVIPKPKTKAKRTWQVLRKQKAINVMQPRPGSRHADPKTGGTVAPSPVTRQRFEKESFLKRHRESRQQRDQELLRRAAQRRSPKAKRRLPGR